MINKKYLNISEVSKILQIEEHKIRYWDSLDPKTNKYRVEGISTKSKALDSMKDDGSGNTQVTIDGDLIVTLNGISKSDLSGYDFIA